MNPLQPLPMSFSRSSQIISDDVEMLQTDVMRFFAILCLCLMAIFALVKALPIAPPDTSPTISEPSDLKVEAQSLQKQIATLKKKLVQMQTQVKAEEIKYQESTDQVLKAEKNRQAVSAKLVKVRQEFKLVSQSLDKIKRDIAIREMKLAKIVKDIVNKRQIRAALKAQIMNETRELSEIQAELNQAQEKIKLGSQKKQVPLSKPSETKPIHKPKKKGFSLRFASDAALERLIISGRVKFYALAAKKAWQIKLGGTQPVYVASPIPRQIYEMENHTVPITYASIFRRQVAAFGQGTVTWGVTLPGSTIASIKRLIKAQVGGDLVITADGKVSLN